MTQSKEIWKDIEGFEGLYQVSNFGKVKSLERTRRSKNNSTTHVNEIILKPNHDKDGYEYISLYKHSKSKSLKIHRLVALYFVDNLHPLSRIVVDHLNNVKTDNHESNLEWVTISTNTQRSFNDGCQIIHTGKDHHLSISVIQVDKISNTDIAKFGSMNEAERQTGVDNSSISRVCRGKQKYAGGFKWEYAND